MPSHTFQISFRNHPSYRHFVYHHQTSLSLSLSLLSMKNLVASRIGKGMSHFKKGKRKYHCTYIHLVKETWRLKKTGKHWEGDLWDPRWSNLLFLFDARFFFFPGSIGDGPVESVLCRLWSSPTPYSSCECDALESNSLSLELRFWHQLQCTQRRKKERIYLQSQQQLASWKCDPKKENAECENRDSGRYPMAKSFTEM